MTFCKEVFAEAYFDVMQGRMPDLDEMPEPVFSERFEKRMEKLIKKEAAHPWAYGHTRARNLLIAAIVAVLLILLAFSAGAIVRRSIEKLIIQHHDTYATIKLTQTEKTKIERVLKIGALPRGCKLKKMEFTEKAVFREYATPAEDYYIIFDQETVSNDGQYSGIFDNEHSTITTLIIDDEEVFLQTDHQNSYVFIGYKAGYLIFLDIISNDMTQEDAIAIYKSIQ